MSEPLPVSDANARERHTFLAGMPAGIVLAKVDHPCTRDLKETDKWSPFFLYDSVNYDKFREEVTKLIQRHYSDDWTGFRQGCQDDEFRVVYYNLLRTYIALLPGQNPDYGSYDVPFAILRHEGVGENDPSTLEETLFEDRKGVVWITRVPVASILRGSEITDDDRRILDREPMKGLFLEWLQAKGNNQDPREVLALFTDVLRNMRRSATG